MKQMNQTESDDKCSSILNSYCLHFVYVDSIVIQLQDKTGSLGCIQKQTSKKNKNKRPVSCHFDTLPEKQPEEMSRKEDTRDNGEKKKTGRRGVHLESVHPLQEG